MCHPLAAWLTRPARLAPLLLAAALGLSASARAQPFTVSVGPAGNTYDLMFKQLAAQCQDEVGLPFVGKVSSGSMDNIDRLINNEVPAAIVQTDVLHYRAKTDELAHIKALFALHPEELHIVALAEPRKVGGFAGIGAKPLQLQQLADLQDSRVGAWGGSLVTALMVRQHADVRYEVVEFADQASALAALGDKSIDAIISVGGSPQPWVQRLDRRFRLLAVGETSAIKLKAVYRVARLSYGNLGQSGVSTVATDAVMVTREYKTPALVAMLGRVRQCFVRHLPELREHPGNHPKWQFVDAAVEPKWPSFQATPDPAAAGKAARQVRR